MTFNLVAFIDEHYDATEDHNGFVCKRCGEVVSYVTKHAVVRHGDDVEVLPVADRNESMAEAY